MGKIEARRSQDSQEIQGSINPYNDEQECAALAVSLSKKRLLEGTASASEICYWLQFASPDKKLDRERKEAEIALTKEKRDSLKAEQASKVGYDQAIAAMKVYSGNGTAEDEKLLRNDNEE